MEKDIAEGNIGTVGVYDIEFKGGKLVAKAKLGTSTDQGLSLEADMLISLDAEKVIDAIAKAIPGQIDDAVLSLIKGALKF